LRASSKLVQHIVGVTATSNSSAKTYDTFIEFGGATGVAVKMKRMRVGYGGGQESAGVDNNFMIQVQRYTTTSTTTPLSLNFSPLGTYTQGSAGNNPTVSGTEAGSIWTVRNAALSGSVTAPTSLTCKVKNAATAFSLGTTTLQLVDEISPNGRALYEWLARDDDDMIVSQVAGYIAVGLYSQTASQVFTVTCDFII
jgi:hypothetical protein